MIVLQKEEGEKKKKGWQFFLARYTDDWVQNPVSSLLDSAPVGTDSNKSFRTLEQFTMTRINNIKAHIKGVYQLKIIVFHLPKTWNINSLR